MSLHGCIFSVTRLAGLLLVLVGAVLAHHTTVAGQPAQGPVYLVRIHDTIDLGLAPYLRRVLDEAQQAGAVAVILEINTPGGRLDAALQMRDAILDSPLRMIAFVNREAFSAGALIALAAQEIVMAPGAVFGAATPVDGSGTTADPKTVSAVRSVFRATAELRGRDPLIAEAMVDPAIRIPDLVEAGELLTLSTDQAQDVGYTDDVAASRAQLLNTAGLDGAAIQERTPGLAENVVRFLTNPATASLLVALGVLLILTDLLAGGFGLIGLAGIGLVILFFWGHALAGLAGWEGIALVGLGIVLIGVEIFLIPGFGIAGVAGLAALIGGLFISLIGGRIVTTADLVRAGATVLGALAALALGLAVLIRYLPRWGRLQGLILQSQVGQSNPTPQVRRRRLWLEGQRLEAQMPAQTTEPVSLLGAVGVALSDLRPSGIAEIAGMRVDVVTQGSYIAAGEPVEVVADEGYRRIVRRLEQRAHHRSSSNS